MDEIYKILNIDSVFQTRFPTLAKSIVSPQTEKVILDSIDRLRDIDEDLYINAVRRIPQQTVDDVIDRVIREARTKGTNLKAWSNKDLRIISYYLSNLHEDERAFSFALIVMRENWKNFIFNGLAIYLLTNWLTDENQYINDVRRLLSTQLKSYQNSNSRYIKMKQNVGLLDDEVGALRMATLIAMKGIKLEEAPRLIGLSPAAISLPYFSEVILKYIEKNKAGDIEFLNMIFQKHNLDRTRKLALAYLIDDADQNGNEIRKNEVTRFARTILGDISLASSWSPFTGATAEDVAKLRKAKDIIIQWNNVNVIKVFFEKCVSDPVRKRYWLKRASSVVDFRIAGVESEKYKLEKDERTKDLVSNYFISCMYKQDTALILCIKNKVFVEFSRVGSLYVHNHNAQCLIPIIKGVKYIAKTDSFKTSIHRKLIDLDDSPYYTSYNPEGRMTHQGEWEYRLNNWFRRVMDNSDAPNIGFTPNNDDNIFVVKEKEPEIRYVDDIKYMLASKDVPAKKGCFVVVNKQGYYVYLPNGMRYAYIKPLSEGETPNGAILIRVHENGWFKVVHVYMKKELDVFYLKIEKRFLIYKLTKEQDNTLKLKL